jgi:DNA-binding NarL/FixJ family response regulator
MKKAIIRHKVFVVDDHLFFRHGIMAYLAVEEDLEVIGEAASAEEARVKCRALNPDIVIVDQRLGGPDGTTLVEWLRQDLPRTRCVVISSFETEEDIHRALSAGAFSYVLKSGSAEDLLRAIRAAAAGEQFLAPEVSKVLESRNRHLELSPREKMVLRNLAAGSSNKEIATALGISTHTVKQYVASLLEKLRVNDRSQAVIEALKRGLIRNESER